MPDNKMTHIVFEVPGEPQGKERPRFTRDGHCYTPEKTRAYDRKVRECYIKLENGLYRRGLWFKPPVTVSIVACYGIPKSASVALQQQMANGEVLPNKKPDLDNIAKAILDALNGLAYSDDKCVTELSMRKVYSGTPGVWVVLHGETIPYLQKPIHRGRGK